MSRTNCLLTDMETVPQTTVVCWSRPLYVLTPARQRLGPPHLLPGLVHMGMRVLMIHVITPCIALPWRSEACNTHTVVPGWHVTPPTAAKASPSECTLE